MNQRNHSGFIRSAGFTLIEIMIALLIGMIGIVVMMQTFAVSEGFKRTATSGTDAQINGGVGLYMMQREIRMAGYGLNAFMTTGCPSVRVWNNVTSTGMDLALYPFQINPAGVPAGDANTDVLMVAFGTADSSVSSMGLTVGQSDPTAPFPLNSNWDSFQTGDLFVSVQPNGATPSCVLHEATATTNPATNCGSTSSGGNQVAFGTASYQQHKPTGCVATTPTYNKATAITDSSGVAVPALSATGGMLYNFGNLSVHVYAIRGGALTMCDWMTANCTTAAGFTPIVDGVVSMRAVYQLNTTPTLNAQAGDGVALPSRASLTTNVYLPSRVMAVTMALVARSALKEKVSPNTGACATTPSATRPDIKQDWIYQNATGAAAGGTIDVSATSTDWGCYRYKLFQTDIPLRNTIWRP
jgi:type IV pilus assembly protein PilW